MATDPTEPARTTLDLNGCARCDADGHPQLEFRRFARPAVVGDIEITHWALCPTTGEPLLMAGVSEFTTTAAISRETPDDDRLSGVDPQDLHS